MQTVSEAFQELFGAKHTHVETVISIDGTDYDAAKIRLTGPTVSGGLFAGSSASVGGTQARECSFTVLGGLQSFPKMAEIKLKIRLMGENGITSEWIPKGTFYIDTRPYDHTSKSTTVTAYDAMLKMEQPMIPKGEPSGYWPKTQRAAMEEIAARIGVELDARCSFNETFVVEFPDVDTEGGEESDATTMRQVAGWIAGGNGGNWTITDAGTLLLVPLGTSMTVNREILSADGTKPLLFGQTGILIRPAAGTADSYVHNLNLSAKNLNYPPPFQIFSGVQFWYDDIDSFFSGSTAGRVLEIECPYATQATADAVLAAIAGKVYQPYTADGAILSPAVELGDGVVVGGVASIIATMTEHFGALFVADIEAPEDEEVNHEYPFQNPTLAKINRKIADTRARITVNNEEINLRIENIEGNLTSEIALLLDKIRLRVVQDGTVASIELYIDDNGTPLILSHGEVHLEGDLIVNGAVSTETLYANYGEIADLDVYRLRTDYKRAKNFLDGIEDDINYIYIHDETIEFWSATVVSTEPVQMLRFGETPLYWTDENHSRMTTETETEWPVMVYQYEELLKSKIEFQQQTENGKTVWYPVYQFGAGNDLGRNMGKIVKDAEGLRFTLSDVDGNDIGLHAHYSGGAEAPGLMWFGTRSEYNNLGRKNKYTTYFIESET